MKLSQKGFTLIETLLVMIAIAIVGGVGFYVYTTRSTVKNEKAKTQQVSVSETEPVKEQQQAYVEFEDLGFRIPKSEKMSDWSYLEDPMVPETKYVQSAAHVKKIDECNKGSNSSSPNIDSASSKSFAAFSRINGTYDSSNGPADVVKQFDDFYIAISYPNGGSPCFNESGVGYPVERAPEGAGVEIRNALMEAEKL